MPVIASLNGIDPERLDRLRAADRRGRRVGDRAQRLLHPDRPRADGREVEQRYVDVLRAVKAPVSDSRSR